MNKLKKFLFIIGTRPEAIKLSPIIINLRREQWAEVKVVSTGQQDEIVEEILSSFNIRIDYKFKVKSKNNNLASTTARLIVKTENLLKEYKPNLALVQGDTSSVIAASIACFYNKVDICHIEAGLRTFDLHNPFPEEFNRTIVSKISKWNFAHSENSKLNLLKEGIPENKIFISGNTSIDALKFVLSKEKKFTTNNTILITIHRRESFGNPIINICRAIKSLASKTPDFEYILPIHTNPKVKKVIQSNLNKVSNLKITKPIRYSEFINILNNSFMVMTDSGGLQEEASFLGIPTLILRTVTERQEVVKSYNAKITGFDTNQIVNDAMEIIKNKNIYRKMSKKNNLFGDGNASKLIIEKLKKDLII